MDYRDPREALRAKKEALAEELAQTDAELRALEASPGPRGETRTAAKPAAETTYVVPAAIGLALVAVGLADAIASHRTIRPWTFDHAAVAPPSAPDPANEGKAITVTAPIAADDS